MSSLAAFLVVLYCTFKVAATSTHAKESIAKELEASLSIWGASIEGKGKYLKTLSDLKEQSQLEVHVWGSGFGNNLLPLNDLEKISKMAEAFPANCKAAPTIAILQRVDTIRSVNSLLRARQIPSFDWVKARQIAKALARLEYIRHSADEMQGLLIWKTDLETLRKISKQAANAYDELERIPASLEQSDDLIKTSHDLARDLETVKPVKPPQVFRDHGYTNRPSGWFDAQKQGVRYDYGRYVGGGNKPVWFSLALAGGSSEHTPQGAWTWDKAAGNDKETTRGGEAEKDLLNVDKWLH